MTLKEAMDLVVDCKCFDSTFECGYDSTCEKCTEAFEMVKEALEKHIPKTPRKTETVYGVDGCGEVTNKLVLYTCPICDEPIQVGRGCSNNDCLQRIDWSDEP